MDHRFVWGGGGGGLKKPKTQETNKTLLNMEEQSLGSQDRETFDHGVKLLKSRGPQRFIFK